MNVAERLQAMGRDLGDQESQVKNLVSGALQRQLDEDFLLEHLGAHSVRGRREKVEIYQLKGMAKDSPSEGQISGF